MGGDPLAKRRRRKKGNFCLTICEYHKRGIGEGERRKMTYSHFSIVGEFECHPEKRQKNPPRSPGERRGSEEPYWVRISSNPIKSEKKSGKSQKGGVVSLLSP